MHTHQFITELIRAANSVEKVGVFEQRRLLERAVTVIYELREAVGIPRSAKGIDAVTNLKILATKVDAIALAQKEVSDGLLEAAGMIRDLHIVRENGMQFSFGARP